MRRLYCLPIARRSIPACACGMLLMLTSPLLAQTGTGTGGTGTGTGGTGTGGTGTGGGTSIDFGGGGGGEGGLAGPTFQAFGADVDTTGGDGFAGRGSAAENFVGGIVQGTGTPGRGGNANQFSAIGRQGQVNRGTQQTGPGRSELIRPRHRVAFTYTPRQSETITSNLQTRLRRLPTQSPISGVSVSLDTNGRATLTGSARNDHDAKLAAALARLEPGVRSVDSQVTVDGAD